MFRRFRKRLATDASEERAADVKAWVESQKGVTLIQDAQPRELVRVAGVVKSLKVRPREGVSAVEAEIDDGTGTVVAVWLGRRTIAGLNLGARLVLEGRLGGARTRLQVMNPTYEFAPPEA